MKHVGTSILPELVSGRGTARRSRVVEGRARRSHVKNLRHCRVEIAQHIAGGDAQSLDPVFGQQGITPGIFRGSFFKAMSLAIRFDAQPRLGTVEVEDEGSGRMLATKLEPVRAGAELRPQGDLGKREGAAQSARSFDGLSWFSQHRVCPSTQLCIVPLPKQSWGRI